MQIKRTLETILATGGKILLIGIIGGLVYKSCFAPTRIENVTVIDKGEYCVEDTESGYKEDQVTITVDKHDKCIRGPNFGEYLNIGDKLEYISFRHGFMGPCDYVVDYKR